MSGCNDTRQGRWCRGSRRRGETEAFEGGSGLQPDDRRQQLVTLTRAGRRRLEQIAQAVDAAQSSLLGDLPPTHRAALVKALQRILDNHASSSE